LYGTKVSKIKFHTESTCVTTPTQFYVFRFQVHDLLCLLRNEPFVGDRLLYISVLDSILKKLPSQ